MSRHPDTSSSMVCHLCMPCNSLSALLLDPWPVSLPTSSSSSEATAPGSSIGTSMGAEGTTAKDSFFGPFGPMVFMGRGCCGRCGRFHLRSVIWRISEEKLREGRSNGRLHTEQKKLKPLANAVVRGHSSPAAQVVQNASYGATTCYRNGENGQQSGSGLSSLDFRGTKGIKSDAFDGTSRVKA